jgi:hypothetical protein
METVQPKKDRRKKETGRTRQRERKAYRREGNKGQKKNMKDNHRSTQYFATILTVGRAKLC